LACIFCQIVAGAIPAKIVYSSPDVTAIRDINPQAPTHVLVIPNRHIASVADLGPSEALVLGRLFEVIGQVAQSEGVAERGYRVVANTGPDAGQTVDHLHFHVLGGRSLAWPPG
jgi:histidine triad (HIT) family protein